MFRYFALFVVLVVGSFVLLMAPPAAAFEPQPIDDLIAAAKILFASLIGIPTVLALILSILEFYGKVSPGQSDFIQMYFNAGLYVCAFLAILFGKTDLLAAIDHYIGGISPILVAILAVITGGTYSVIQTRRHLDHIRSLYPVQLRARTRFVGDRAR